LVNHFKGSQTLSQPVAQMEPLATHPLDLADIKGHDKR
jgi:hypothetical protein